MPFEKSVAKFPNLVAHPEPQNESVGFVLVEGEYEDANSRGQHDGELGAEQMLDLSALGENRH
ncbi:hypothetical protein ACCS45_03945 [Rhizobium ruizarguesonis]